MLSWISYGFAPASVDAHCGSLWITCEIIISESQSLADLLRCYTSGPADSGRDLLFCLHHGAVPECRRRRLCAGPVPLVSCGKHSQSGLSLTLLSSDCGWREVLHGTECSPSTGKMPLLLKRNLA